MNGAAPQTPLLNGKSIKLLNRSELQSLFKSYGLKGANAKNSDLVEALKAHMKHELEGTLFDQSANAAEPSGVDEFNDASNESNNVFVEQEADFDESVHEIVEVVSEQMNEEIMESEVPSNSDSIAEEQQRKMSLTEADQISHWLMDHELHHLASLFEMEELMSWELIKKLDVEMLRRLGLTFGMILKFTQLLEDKFPELRNEKKSFSMTEIRTVVNEMIKGDVSSKPAGANKAVMQSTKMIGQGIGTVRPKTAIKSFTSHYSAQTSQSMGQPAIHSVNQSTNRISTAKPRIDSNLKREELTIPRSLSSGSMKENAKPVIPVFGYKKTVSSTNAAVPSTLIPSIQTKKEDKTKPFMRDLKWSAKEKTTTAKPLVI